MNARAFSLAENVVQDIFQSIKHLFEYSKAAEKIDF